jgi:hypothetical protein
MVPAADRRRLRSCAQVAILGRVTENAVPIRARRMAFWERPTPALADRELLGRLVFAIEVIWLAEC